MGSDVGRRIQEAIDMAGWDQRRLAQALDVSTAKITRFVKDTNKRWSIPELEQMASILGVNPRWLAGWEISPIPAPSGTSPAKEIPLLGCIAAGIPLLASQQIERYIPVPGDSAADFALRVKGDSMTGACIPDGSIVYCRKQSDVEHGEIAACIVDGEDATLKRVHRHDGIVILRADNPNYQDIVLTAKGRNQLRIVGKAVAVFAEL